MGLWNQLRTWSLPVETANVQWKLNFEPYIWQGLCCLGGRYFCTGVVEGRILTGNHGRMYSIRSVVRFPVHRAQTKHKPHISIIHVSFYGVHLYAVCMYIYIILFEVWSWLFPLNINPAWNLRLETWVNNLPYSSGWKFLHLHSISVIFFFAIYYF
jgi:hypothetical protein